MSGGGFAWRAAAFVSAALALASVASCASNSGSGQARAGGVTDCASRPGVAASYFGLRALPVQSSQSAGYYSAQYAWAVSNTSSGDAGGAGEGAYLEVAITDLQLGLARDYRLPGGMRAYRTAIRELRQIAALPDTDETPKQQAEYAADVDRLNHFFDTKVPV